MTKKPFNIHDWQAKQRLTEMPEERTSLDKAVDAIMAMIGGRLATWQNTETIQSSHHMMALLKRDEEKLRMMTTNILRDDYRMEESNTTGTGASFSAGSGETYATPNAFKKKEKED